MNKFIAGVFTTVVIIAITYVYFYRPDLSSLAGNINRNDDKIVNKDGDNRTLKIEMTGTSAPVSGKKEKVHHHRDMSEFYSIKPGKTTTTDVFGNQPTYPSGMDMRKISGIVIMGADEAGLLKSPYEWNDFTKYAQAVVLKPNTQVAVDLAHHWYWLVDGPDCCNRLKAGEIPQPRVAAPAPTCTPRQRIIREMCSLKVDRCGRPYWAWVQFEPVSKTKIIPIMEQPYKHTHAGLIQLFVDHPGTEGEEKFLKMQDDSDASDEGASNRAGEVTLFKINNQQRRYVQEERPRHVQGQPQRQGSINGMQVLGGLVQLGERFIPQRR